MCPLAALRNMARITAMIGSVDPLFSWWDPSGNARLLERGAAVARLNEIRMEFNVRALFLHWWRVLLSSSKD